MQRIQWMHKSNENRQSATKCTQCVEYLLFCTSLNWKCNISFQSTINAHFEGENFIENQNRMLEMHWKCFPIYCSSIFCITLLPLNSLHFNAIGLNWSLSAAICDASVINLNIYQHNMQCLECLCFIFWKSLGSSPSLIFVSKDELLTRREGVGTGQGFCLSQINKRFFGQPYPSSFGRLLVWS